MRKTFILQLVVAILSLIAVIIVGVMPGEKTKWWQPVLIVSIIAFILFLLAAIYAFLDVRNEEEGWTGLPEIIESFLLFVFNAVSGLLLLAGIIIYIVALTSDGMTHGETHMVEENAREAEFKAKGVGECSAINMLHSFCDQNLQECLDYSKFCAEKTNDHPTQISALVFLILALIADFITIVLLIMEKADENDDGMPLNQSPSYKSATARDSRFDYPNGHQSPLV